MGSAKSEVSLIILTRPVVEPTGDSHPFVVEKLLFTIEGGKVSCVNTLGAYYDTHQSAVGSIDLSRAIELLDQGGIAEIS